MENESTEMLICCPYVTGWLATGPVVVILSTLTYAFSFGLAVEADVCFGRVTCQTGQMAVAKLLSDRSM